MIRGIDLPKERAMNKRLLCLLCLVLTLGLSFAETGRKPDNGSASDAGNGKPRVAVFGLVNLTGDQSFSIPAETANDGLSLILRMLQRYEVVSVDELPRDLSNKGLSAWCLAHGANYFLYGTILPGSGGSQEYRIAVYDNLKGQITIRKAERGESVFDVFSVCDSLTNSVAEALVGHRLVFGSLEFANAGYKDDFTVWIDGLRLADNPSTVERIIAGTHTIRITRMIYQKDTPILEREVTVVEGKPTRFEFALEEVRDASAAPIIAAGGVIIPPYVKIAGGWFTMGDDTVYDGFDVGGSNIVGQARPAHTVSVRDFIMGTTEVTQGQYEKVVGSNPSRFKGANLPVEGVSWVEACIYCNRLSMLEGYTPAYVIIGDEVTWDQAADGYRLPTDAEWEYACKAGKNDLYPNGYILAPADANYGERHCHNPEEKNKKKRIYTLPVASFAPNAWGLYDLFGNVSEWCWDWYGPYVDNRDYNPTGPKTGQYRVTRGGDWTSRPETMKSVNRNPQYPSKGSGFRVVRNCGN